MITFSVITLSGTCCIAISFLAIEIYCKSKYRKNIERTMLTVGRFILNWRAL